MRRRRAEVIVLSEVSARRRRAARLRGSDPDEPLGFRIQAAVGVVVGLLVGVLVKWIFA